jgi:hypothetical protein
MYTRDERGILNNYASEPQMYFADYPSVEQQRNYLLQAGIATLLVSALMLTALAIS